MVAAKLVKILLIVILFCAEILPQTKGMRTNNEEEAHTPEARIMYDQRQSGKYNIHVVIKDVAIIEMDQNQISDQNYNDEEYYYDEDDLTVKPLIMKTTTTTTSVKPIDSTTASKATTPHSMQTTMSFSDTQSVDETTTKFSQDTFFNSTLAANITTPETSHKEELNSTNGDFMTTTHRPENDIKSRSKIEPIYAIEEPVFHSRHQIKDFNYGSIPDQADSRDSKIFTNSKIYKVKLHHRTHRTPQMIRQRERCRSFQNRDARGNCRGKRTSSGSILKRLFRMLITLPFEQEEQ